MIRTLSARYDSNARRLIIEGDTTEIPKEAFSRFRNPMPALEGEDDIRYAAKDSVSAIKIVGHLSNTLAEYEVVFV